MSKPKTAKYYVLPTNIIVVASDGKVEFARTKYRVTSIAAQMGALRVEEGKWEDLLSSTSQSRR